MGLTWLAGITGARADAERAKIVIVAAENFYGDIAHQVGGDRVSVASILSNPDQDPHLFEASASTARAMAAARLVIANGIGYDAWIESLLSSTSAPGRKIIMVSALRGKSDGDNPHLWYDPATMPAVAGALAEALGTLDPGHASEYQARMQRFLASLEPLSARIAADRTAFAGTPVTATEPVFAYMATALGFVMRNERFQLAVMNDTEPRPSDVAAFEDDLRQHRVRLLLYNRQTVEASSKRLLALADAERIPVVGITETEPAAMTYQDWMAAELGAIEAALRRH